MVGRQFVALVIRVRFSMPAPLKKEYKMKIIFLDIDGVLNTLMVDTEPFSSSRGQILRDKFYYKLNMPNDLEVSNRQAVMWLNKLCIETNAKIVITSTWRMGVDGLENTKKALYNSGLIKDVEIIDATPILQEPKDMNIRGHEIQMWLDKHQNIDNYVILDDDVDMLENQLNHLVQVNTYYGFGFPDYEKAIKIFEG